MCIAVIKPKGVEMPDQKTLFRCFQNNSDGAGFMYSDGDKLVIKKGYMTFNDFYTALTETKLKKEQLVFLHFRIATHGLKDGGNTHPFPISSDINELRSVKNTFKDYGLIHNGVFHFNQEQFIKYDPTNTISDTMLFSMLIHDSIERVKNGDFNEDYKFTLTDIIAYTIMSNNDEFNNYIEEKIGWNKIAIMDEKENFFKYGNWIEDNGMFYSNSDYKEYNYYNSCYNWDNWDYDDYSYNHNHNNYNYNSNNTNDDIIKCSICEMNINKNNIVSINGENYCLQCSQFVNDGSFIECYKCKQYFHESNIFVDDDGFEVCQDCFDDNLYVCDCCKKSVNFLRSLNGKLFCSSCYMLESKKTPIKA